MAIRSWCWRVNESTNMLNILLTLPDNLFLTCTLYGIVLNWPLCSRKCFFCLFFFCFWFFFYREESGTSLVTNPTWVVKTCLCLQYLNTELKEMYSDFGKSRVRWQDNLKTVYQKIGLHFFNRLIVRHSDCRALLL